MPEKIQLKHPEEGKKNTNIEKKKYEQVRRVMLALFSDKSEITHGELMKEMTARLSSEGFDGNPGWYSESLKLHLEAEGIIRRVPGSKPQKIEKI